MTRELHFHAKVLLDVPDPGDVRIDTVDGAADQLHVALGEVVVALRELDELSGAHRSEIRRMREQHHPLAFGREVAEL